MNPLPPNLPIADKAERLLAILRPLGSAAVALSGGVDSSVVAKAAFEALGPRAVALTADSPSVPRAELELAEQIARQIGIRHVVVRTNEFADDNYLRNDGSRCYYCKSELYDRIADRLAELDVAWICSGANLDDLGDYRPGLRAAAERHVRHPLQEAGFHKADIRELAQYWKLENWNKPASPCLSSRLAPGVEVTAERTHRVELAEAYLKGLGFSDCRVRLHEGELARIELPQNEMGKWVNESLAAMVADKLLGLGFRYVSLDLRGLRSGGLNELVPLEVRARFSQQN